MRIHFGRFVFDADARELRAGEEPVHLTPKAFELLWALIEARPRAMRKEELRNRLWPDVVVNEGNLKNLVAEVRSVIGRNAIRTVHRHGYAFAASASVSSARLVDANSTHYLRPGANVIGRDAGCSVALDFSGISRRHAEIHVAENRCSLRDLGSKNGTWRNEEPVREAVDLHDGDRIRLGGVPLTFRSLSTIKTTTTAR